MGMLSSGLANLFGGGFGSFSSGFGQQEQLRRVLQRILQSDGLIRSPQPDPRFVDNNQVGGPQRYPRFADQGFYGPPSNLGFGGNQFAKDALRPSDIKPGSLGAMFQDQAFQQQQGALQSSFGQFNQDATAQQQQQPQQQKFGQSRQGGFGKVDRF